MSTKKISEANHIFSELLPLNDEIDSKICQCSYPHNRILYAYKMADIERRAMSFVDPIIFALEYHERGSRIFFCCSRIHFPHYFFRVRTLKPEYPTWHEILSNLNKTNLYFDLEYYTANNPNLNGEKIGEDFKLCLKQYLIKNGRVDSKFLEKSVNLTDDDDDIQFVEFDATIPTKFSRHLIVFLKDFAFESAADVGRFVQELSRSVEFKEKFSFFNKGGTKKESLMDFSVYHEWQNLRMLGSPKFGRTNTLHYVKPLQNHEFRFHEGCALCSQMLMNTLATASNLRPADTYWHSDGDSMLKLNRTLVENYSDSLFPNNDHYKYQFIVRSFVCGVIFVIFEKKKLCEDKESSSSVLFKEVIAKLGESAIFWSFEATYWDPIVTATEKYFESFLSASNAEILRFELGNLLVLLDELQYRITSSLVKADDIPVEPISTELDQPAAGTKSAKKCRKNMSLLLRFLQSLEPKMENNQADCDFTVLNKTYHKFMHDLPTSFRGDFPADLNKDNLSNVKVLAALLSNQEDEIRNGRLEKVAAKTQALLERVKRRREEEEQFRSTLISSMKKIDDQFLLNLVDLVLTHSSSLQFHL